MGGQTDGYESATEKTAWYYYYTPGNNWQCKHMNPKRFTLAYLTWMTKNYIYHYLGALNLLSTSWSWLMISLPCFHLPSLLQMPTNSVDHSLALFRSQTANFSKDLPKKCHSGSYPLWMGMPNSPIFLIVLPYLYVGCVVFYHFDHCFAIFWVVL